MTLPDAYIDYLSQPGPFLPRGRYGKITDVVAAKGMNIARLEHKLVVVSETMGVAVYDFDFDLNFQCEHPYMFEGEELCVLRIGPIADYSSEFEEKRAIGLRLVNTPDEHRRASELEYWYPLISDLTPRSQVYDELPPASAVEAEFQWPVFIKGSRQTSRHSAALSIASSAEEYERIRIAYAKDDILHWQKPVIREFVPLASVAGTVPGQVQPSIEYRSFWWRGVCVGWGRYWFQVPQYSEVDVQVGLKVAQEVVTRLAVPFLVVDLAKAVDGRWIVIECNDAQESGYCGIPPKALWERVLASI